MKKLFCVICSKYRKFEKPKISYLLQKTLVLSIICSKCKNEEEKIFKEEDSIEKLKNLALIGNIYLIWKYGRKKLGQEFRLKNIDERRNYLTEEIYRNESIIKKHKKVCTTLNYIEHFLILASTMTGCVFISDFASLIGIPIGITSSTSGLKIYAENAGIKKHMSIIKKKKKKHDKIVLLAKSKFLISKALIDSVVSHDEFVLINNVLIEYNQIKEEIKNLKT